MEYAVRDTVALDEENQALVIIDQTRLPQEEVYLRLDQAGEIVEAIQKLRVRGAPAIGVAAAMGLYVCACRVSESDAACWRTKVRQIGAQISAARPTAVNLSWAVGRMLAVLDGDPGRTIPETLRALHDEACTIRDGDVRTCMQIGENGAALIRDGMAILTHCNAGRLAAVRYGTALAPVYRAAEQGKRIRVFADETRPLLQGARLTAYELSRAGIDVTLLCDNMAASLMAQGRIDAVFVGCDRVAANGDAANKIGTLGVAILAKHFGVPFYVCAPTSTVDLSCPCGEQIVIEQRDPSEVSRMWYAHPMAPEGIRVYNPAFDVTPHELITAMITEKGVCRDYSNLPQLV